MLLRLHKFILDRITRHKIADDDEMFRYLATTVADLYCTLAHVYFFFLFALNKLPLFTVLNAVSLSVYFVTLLLFRKRQYTLIGLMISLEVTIYATLMGCLTGISTYVIGYFVLVILMQATVPYGTQYIRAAIILLCALCAIICLMSHFAGPPAIAFSQNLNNILLVSNIVLLMAGSIVEISLGQMLQGIIRKMNAAKMEELSTQAFIDPLTGLYNRRYADTYFQTLSTSQSPYCVAMLDIDDFKLVNDTYGHACGDSVLVFLADFLLANLRKSDAVFRWGGEEYLIVLENTTLCVARQVFEKLQAKLAEMSISTSHCEIQITITVGVAVLDVKNIRKSIEHSDRNMYRGKNSGKNTVVADL